LHFAAGACNISEAANNQSIVADARGREKYLLTRIKLIKICRRTFVRRLPSMSSFTRNDAIFRLRAVGAVARLLEVHCEKVEGWSLLRDI
jgi:hypothetical protein